MTTSLWKRGAIGSCTTCIPPSGCGVGTRSGEGMLPLQKKSGRLNGEKSNHICCVLNAKI